MLHQISGGAENFFVSKCVLYFSSFCGTIGLIHHPFEPTLNPRPSNVSHCYSDTFRARDPCLLFDTPNMRRRGGSQLAVDEKGEEGRSDVSLPSTPLFVCWRRFGCIQKTKETSRIWREDEFGLVLWSYLKWPRGNSSMAIFSLRIFSASVSDSNASCIWTSYYIGKAKSLGSHVLCPSCGEKASEMERKGLLGTRNNEGLRENAHVSIWTSSRNRQKWNREKKTYQKTMVGLICEDRIG